MLVMVNAYALKAHLPLSITGQIGLIQLEPVAKDSRHSRYGGHCLRSQRQVVVQTVNRTEVVVLLLLLLQGGDGVLLQQLHLHQNLVLFAALLKVNQFFARVQL